GFAALPETLLPEEPADALSVAELPPPPPPQAAIIRVARLAHVSARRVRKETVALDIGFFLFKAI
ncbi:MAG: hypothetical protein ACO1NO_09645, partial [Burkholderiaceae bacterium]